MTRWIKTTVIVFGIGIGVGVVSCVFRIFTRKKQEEIIEKTKNRVKREMKIPKSFVGLVLGRNGATIKGIREKTKARVNFEDTDNEFTIATIVGYPEEVDEAVELISKILTGRPSIITKELSIPEKFSDYLIGKNGENIKQICLKSHAKITIDWSPDKDNKATLKMIIKGKKEEVDIAVEIIDELIAEAEVHSNRLIHIAGRALPEKLLPLNLSDTINKIMPCEKLIPNGKDGFIEVYISAIQSPSKFWVQISGSKSIQLDKLATEMTSFYEDEKNKLKFQLNIINPGDVVAAYYDGDNSWYRGRVLEVKEENDKKNVIIFYLDFGDSATLSPNLICKLKPDFLSIPFQAIECTLFDVEPKNGSWSEEAIETFGKLVYLAQWKVIMAKPIEYQHNDDNPKDNSIQPVQLFDTNTDTDICIAEHLIAKGFATMKLM